MSVFASQGISARSNGPQRFRHSVWRAAPASRVRFSLVWLHLCAQRTQSNTSRAAPAANLLLPPSDPYDGFSLLWALCTHSGDLSKMQWPAALQELNLEWCRQITGAFQPHCAPNEHHRTSLVRPQPQTSFFLILTSRWLFSSLGSLHAFRGPDEGSVARCASGA